MNTELLAEVHAWIADDPDPATAELLRTYIAENNEVELKKCFSGFLQFGTAGLRGPLGPGPSCMNQAVVGRTATGLARYMSTRGLRSVVIGRDARHGSEDFTRVSAEILSGAGMEVFILPEPLPTPVLAFAVNELGVDVGIMVTASHNPAQDNGYKVYLGGTVDGVNYQGSQIISPADSQISHEVSLITSLAKQPRGNDAIVLDSSIVEKYVTKTALIAGKHSMHDIKIVYSAMHGVGTSTLQQVFHKAGFAQPILVEGQSKPDPDFPTLPFPNPEEPGAMNLSLETARTFRADIVLANDPDADRCAVAVKAHDSSWRMLGGDEIGAILGQYIASTSPTGVLATSIVSSSILGKIALAHDWKFETTLTGFKWLSKVENLTFGYEEALGYCVDSGTVNDKDGISAGLLLAKIASQLKLQSKSLIDYLDEIWNLYGFHGNEQISHRCQSLDQVHSIMERVKLSPPTHIAHYLVSSIDNLAEPTDGLPPTEGLRLWLEDGIRIIIRPSGTEAKIKCYIEVISHLGRDEATKILNKLRTPLSQYLKHS